MEKSAADHLTSSVTKLYCSGKNNEKTNNGKGGRMKILTLLQINNRIAAPFSNYLTIRLYFYQRILSHRIIFFGTLNTGLPLGVP